MLEAGRTDKRIWVAPTVLRLPLTATDGGQSFSTIEDTYVTNSL